MERPTKKFRHCKDESSACSQDNDTQLAQIPIEKLLDDIIKYVFIPLIDVKSLHYLMCSNFKWLKRIKKFIMKSAPRFELKIKFGSSGSDDGQLSCTWFVTSDKQGNIYVSDSDNGRIQIFDSNGQWKQCIGLRGS